jgi:glycosyltransferase involved in cell wall biosynthesis
MRFDINPKGRPLSVLHIIGSADPKLGGPIEAIKQQAQCGSAGRFHVTIVSLDDPSAEFAAECEVPLVALGGHGSRKLPWRLLPWKRYGYTPKFVPWLRKNAQRYDIIVVNGLWNYSSFGARQALSGSGVPYVIFTHGMLDPWFRKAYPVKFLFKQLLWWISEGNLLRNANAVLFTSEEEMILARSAFWPYRVKEKVVGFGTADVSGDPAVHREAFFQVVPQLRGRRYLLFLGRIHIKKGCDLLIKAFAQIAEFNADIFLVIAGPDQTGWRKDLDALALDCGVADRIFWPGMLTGHAKWGAFCAAEAFVLPSHQENFGIVVAEAMASSKPVLITDKVNIWREVVAAGAGFVEPDNLGGIVRLLTRFLALSPSAREEMGKQARLGFLQHFEIGNAVRSINMAFVEAVA